MPQIRQTAHVSRRAVAWRNTGPWRHLTGAGATLVAGAMIVAAGPTPGMAAATAAPRPGFRAALDQTSRPRLRAALDQTSRPRLRAALEQTSHLGFRAELERIVDDGIPGVVGLARRGGHAVTAASGDADIAAAQPMAVDDRFR
ncbi:MAG TPA: hypothetical protein VGS19_25550, partial [Streptosporangiaceae bacterium]|nr:hypothetical protein [Streptosporangiaceae bacterium]